MSFINNIKKSGSDLILYSCPIPSNEILISGGEVVKIAFLDTETTGLDYKVNEIIELAVKVVFFEKISGKIVSIDKSYESFHQPQLKIDSQISLITGISNKMVEGKKIDWLEVDNVLTDVDLIISHNALFDKAFIDHYSNVSKQKNWGCSIKDINWIDRGFISSKQELLCYWHGFYFEAHRAMNDVNALIHLVTHPSYLNKKPILELIQNSESSVYLIWVTNFPFNENKKNIIKGNGYHWNVSKKTWFKRVLSEEIEKEKQFLIKTIYLDQFLGEIEEVDILNKYKL